MVPGYDVSINDITNRHRIYIQQTVTMPGLEYYSTGLKPFMEYFYFENRNQKRGPGRDSPPPGM